LLRGLCSDAAAHTKALFRREDVFVLCGVCNAPDISPVCVHTPTIFYFFMARQPASEMNYSPSNIRSTHCHMRHAGHLVTRVRGDGLPKEQGGVEESIEIEFGDKVLSLSLVWTDGDEQLAPLFSGVHI
jgi:hypothetical protein